MVTHDRDLARHARRMLVIVDGELIPETLSQAFPEMRHRDLLFLSHRIIPHVSPPGQVTLASLEDEDRLFMVTRGEMLVSDSAGAVTRLVETGEWFRSSRLGLTGQAKLSAGSEGAEYLEIPTEGIQIPDPGRSRL